MSISGIKPKRTMEDYKGVMRFNDSCCEGISHSNGFGPWEGIRHSRGVGSPKSRASKPQAVRQALAVTAASVLRLDRPVLIPHACRVVCNAHEALHTVLHKAF